MDPRVRLLLKLISEHNLSEPFDSTEPSKWLGLSEPYLLRLFHRELGKTVRRVLMDVRISKAAQLLKASATPIKQVASECGYSDISNFYRDFKIVHGITPKEFRLTMLANIGQPYPFFHHKAVSDNREHVPTIVERPLDIPS